MRAPGYSGAAVHSGRKGADAASAAANQLADEVRIVNPIAGPGDQLRAAHHVDRRRQGRDPAQPGDGPFRRFAGHLQDDIAAQRETDHGDR